MKKMLLLLTGLTILSSCESESITSGPEPVQNFSQESVNSRDNVTELTPLEEINNIPLEQRINDETVASKNGFITCQLIVSNPFASQLVTFQSDCPSNPTVDCFDIKLKAALTNEIWKNAFPSAKGDPSGGEFVSNEGANLTLSQLIDTSNIDPFISVTSANEVYRHFACEMLDEIDNLPTLPSNQGYVVNIIFLETDHPFSPPAAATEISYQIRKITIP